MFNGRRCECVVNQHWRKVREVIELKRNSEDVEKMFQTFKEHHNVLEA